MDHLETVRYFSRKGVSIDDVAAQAKTSPTPAPVFCFTPLQSSVSTPKALALPESIPTDVWNYINGSFDSGTWIKSAQIEHCSATRENREDSNHSAEDYLTDFDVSLPEVCDLFNLHRDYEA